MRKRLRRILLMKNKTLKHYKRKRFFYRFFMRKSPRSGAMFGLAWMICFGAMLPLAPWIFLQMVLQAKYDFNTADIILLLTGAILFFTICLSIYAYGFSATPTKVKSRLDGRKNHCGY